MRRLARERGIDLSNIQGSGRKGRITKDDLERPAAAPAAEPAAAPALGGLPPWPKVDHESFGPVERVALSRIKKLSGPNLARNWVMIPHVTHQDEADITELEAFRKETNAAQKDVKVTMVALLVKACVASLQAFPEFNSSLDGDELVLKRYWHIGFAADTPQGLVVPVIKDADQKGILDIARELTELSGAAREGKLKLDRDARRDVHDLEPRRHRRHRLHADRQRPRGGDPRRHPLGDEAGVGRRRVPAAADGAAVALLRPPGDRRRAGRALHRPPRGRAVRPAEGPAVTEVRVPDIGDFTDVPVIEVLVEPGSAVAAEDPLVTLESDKATMDVPAPEAGTVAQLAVKVGDKVSQGSLILSLEAEAATDGGPPPPAEPAEDAAAATARRSSCSAPARAATRRPSAPPTSASTPCSSSATSGSAASA